MSGVVVLNASFEPLGVVPLRRALLYMMRDRVVVVEAAPGRMLHSAQREMPVPLVVQFRHYIRVPYRFVEAPWSRRRLLERDHHRCAYCGRHAMTVDHVVPVSHGGDSSWMNTVAACVKCNGLKANRTPEQARMELRYLPRVITTRDILIESLASTGANLTALGIDYVDHTAHADHSHTGHRASAHSGVGALAA